MAPQTSPQLTEHYSDTAGEYSTKMFRCSLEADGLLTLLGLDAGGNSSLSILDVGCGAGHFLEVAAQRTTGRLVGLDNAIGMLYEATFSRVAPNVVWETVDIMELLTLPLPALRSRINLGPDEYFDIVTCSHVLVHFAGLEAEVLNCLGKVVRPGGGRLVFTADGDPSCFGSIGRAWLPTALTPRPNWFSVEYIAPDSVLAAVERNAQAIAANVHGFGVVAIRESTSLSVAMTVLRGGPYGLGHPSLTIHDPSGNSTYTWIEALNHYIQNSCTLPLTIPLPANRRADDQIYWNLFDVNGDALEEWIQTSQAEFEAVQRARGESRSVICDACAVQVYCILSKN